MEWLSSISDNTEWAQLDVPSGIRHVSVRNKGELGEVFEATA
jgi:hypothetical protein